MVDGLKAQYGDRMNFVQKNFEVGDSPAEIKKYFPGEKHGMVIVDAHGEAVWTEGGHKQQRVNVVKAIQKVLDE
jgi:hypothetical protein